MLVITSGISETSENISTSFPSKPAEDNSGDNSRSMKESSMGWIGVEEGLGWTKKNEKKSFPTC